FAWPSPEVVTLTVFTGATSRLVLPVRPQRPTDAEPAPFAEAETAQPAPTTWLRHFTRNWTASRDLISDRYEMAYRTDGGRWRLEGTGIEYDFKDNNIATITEGNPLSAQIRCELSIEIAEKDWQTRVEVTSVLSSDLTTFRVAVGLDAYEGDVRAFNRSWSLAIPRDLV